MAILARCVKCNSRLVCFNWGVVDDIWTHECWVCDKTFTTYGKVRIHVPYKTLKYLIKLRLWAYGFPYSYVVDEDVAKNEKLLKEIFGETAGE